MTPPTTRIMIIPEILVLSSAHPPPLCFDNTSSKIYNRFEERELMPNAGGKKFTKRADADVGSDISEEINKEELKSAKDVVQLLTKTAKTLKIYLPNNPIHQKFLQDLTDHFAGHLHEYGAFRLRI